MEKENYTKEGIGCLLWITLLTWLVMSGWGGRIIEELQDRFTENHSLETGANSASFLLESSGEASQPLG